LSLEFFDAFLHRVTGPRIALVLMCRRERDVRPELDRAELATETLRAVLAPVLDARANSINVKRF
jgi:hypothetical protein